MGHEETAAALADVPRRNVAAQRLGRVYRSRGVNRSLGSMVEPDGMVRPIATTASWVAAPVPMLVVRIGSDVTRRREGVESCQLDVEVGIPALWIVDGEGRAATTS